MSYNRSNISASLHRKRKVGLMKRIFAYFIFILFFISLFVLATTKEEFKIKNISLIGNTSISKEDIMKFVDDEVNTRYFWIIHTDNVVLLRKSQIKNQIIENIKKINSVEVVYSGFREIEIKIKERIGESLWCKGAPTDSNECYFIDSEGFIFEESPTFSSDNFAKYFGLITEANPIGQTYFKDNFKNISSILKNLDLMSFKPRYFVAVSEHEYEIYILGGGKILMNDKRSFESSLQNLQALISGGYIKNSVAFLPKIKYIDLRFGNKVNFELVK